MTGLVVLATGALALLLLLAVTTAGGERRRGGSWALAVVAGAVFPVTWTVWYVRDRRPAATTGAGGDR